MQKNILSLIKNYLFWTIFFVFFKCIFLLANYEFTSALTSNEIGKIFLYGLKMDLSAAGYLTLLPGLIIALSPLIGKICDKILSVYTMVILILMSIIGLADTSIYPSWGTRIDAQAIPYITDPVAVLSSVSTLQLIASIVAIIAIVTLFYILHKKLVVSTDINKEEKWYKVTPTILILTAALILPIRGGIDSAPLNFSSVYFSPKTYPNHAAYNFFWSFSYALTHNEYGKNPVSYMSDEEAERIMSNEIDSDDKDIPLVINKTDNKTNVILVILESFSNKTIYPLATANAKFDKEHNIEQKYYNPSDKRLETLTPNLNRYCGEGITFTNFYATGTRSDRGISSLLAGFPALIKASSILGFPEKMKSLTYLPQLFKKNGYELSFYYGGDLDFYNTNIMLVQSGIDKVVARSQFPLKQSTMQKWGAPDEYLYKRLGDDIQTMKRPYFSIVYNISSHEPFDVPNHYNKIKGTSNSDRYLNSIAYTDSCLGDFIEKIRRTPEWENTLVIITSDHTSLMPSPETTPYELASYRVPMIWIGGAVSKHETIDKICCQTDLYATLNQQLGLSAEVLQNAKPYSNNMFGEKQYALFFRSDGWGYVSPEIAFYSNIDNGKRTYYYNVKEKADSITHFAEAYTQYLHNDFIER